MKRSGIHIYYNLSVILVVVLLIAELFLLLRYYRLQTQEEIISDKIDWVERNCYTSNFTCFRLRPNSDNRNAIRELDSICQLLQHFQKELGGEKIRKISSFDIELAEIVPAGDSSEVLLRQATKSFRKIEQAQGELHELQIEFANYVLRYANNIGRIEELIRSHILKHLDRIRLWMILLLAINLAILVINRFVVYRIMFAGLSLREQELTQTNEQLLQLNQELAITQERLEATSEMAQIGGWEYEVQSGHFNLSKNAKTILGLSSEDACSLKSLIALFDASEEGFMLHKCFSEAIRLGRPWDIEVKFNRGDTPVWIRVIGTAEIVDGRTLRLKGSLQNIQDQKIRSLQLEESESKYRSLAQYTGHAVLLVDFSGTIREVNETAVKMFQTDRITLLSRPFNQLFDPEFTETSSRSPRFADAFNPEETTAYHISGTSFPCQIQSNQFTDKNGVYQLVYSIRDLSTYYQLQKSREEVQSHLQSIMDHAPMPIFLKDLNYQFIMVNKAYELFRGVSEADLLGKREEDLFEPVDCWCNELEDQLVKTKIPVSAEKTVRVRGAERVLHFTKFLVMDQNQLPRAICGMIQDQTESKISAQKLLESAERLKKLTDTVDIGIYQFTMRPGKPWCFDFMSDGFIRIYPEIMNHNPYENISSIFNVIHPEDISRVYTSIEYAHHHFIEWHAEFRFRIQKQYRWFKGTAKPERQSDGAVTWYGYFEDVTQRREELEQLKLYQSVVTNTTDMIAITSMPEQESAVPEIIYVNEAFARKTGYSEQELMHQKIDLLNGPLTDHNLVSEIKKRLFNFEAVHAELLHYRKNGDTFWNQFSIIPISNEKGIYTHLIFVSNDVTQQKQYISSIEQKNKKLQEIAWLQSHTVRAPLAKLMGLINVHENYPDEMPDKIHQLIRQAADELDLVIRNIVQQAAGIDENMEENDS